jgi:hypothetical protein
MPLPFVFALVLGGSTPRACLRRNWTVSDSLPILRISSLHLASRCSYNPPRAPRLPKAAPSARRKSSSLDSELPSDPPPAEEDELVRSRSARDTLLARETRRLDARFRNELASLSCSESRSMQDLCEWTLMSLRAVWWSGRGQP